MASSEKLTKPQFQLLRDAARDLDGDGLAFVRGPGRARAAKNLEAFGLGRYWRRRTEGSRFNLSVTPARFVINDNGIDLIDHLAANQGDHDEEGEQ